MMWYWHDGMSWWAWAGMTISLAIFWGLVILGIVLLVRAVMARSPRSTIPEQNSAKKLLAERFARGEISEDEYRNSLAVLEASADFAVPGHPQSS